MFATLIRLVTINIPYGSTIVPRGTRLPVLSRSAQTVTVQYLNQPQTIALDTVDPP
ncbi:MAG: hypothetical protein ABI540_07545 [Spartobacteria bacterium]